MDYPDKPEYYDWLREAVEENLLNYFMCSVGVEWHSQNSFINKAQKVDVSVLIMTDFGEQYNLQLKKSDTLAQFTVNKSALRAYLTKKLPVDYLGVIFQEGYEVYLFGWQDFVDYAKETYRRWRDGGNYYTVDLQPMLQLLDYEFLNVSEEMWQPPITWNEEDEVWD